MNMRSLFLGASVALVATAALATVTFDPATGTGFVGKGDVQTVFGWNNQAAQNYATQVTFKFDKSTVYTVDFANCSGSNTFTDAPDTCTHGTVHTGNVMSTQGINAMINGAPRNGPNQYTGFILSGFQGNPVITSGSVPYVGEGCNADPTLWAAILPVLQGSPNFADATHCQITNVTVLSSGGGLYVGINSTQWTLLQSY